MLRKLHKKKNLRRAFWILTILIVPAFVFWGSGSIIKSRQKNYAGRIFGRKVSLSEYKSAFLACRNQAIMQFGEEFYKVKKYLDLQTQAWDRLILLYEAKRRKIKVGDKEVIQAIRNNPLFKKDDSFNAKLYSYFLDYILQVPARTFEEEIRDSLLLIKLYNQVSAGIVLKEKEILDEYSKENEKVSVEYIFIDPKEYQEGITPEEVELKEYFSKNRQAFKNPPSLNIQYIGIDTQPEATIEEKKEALSKMQKISKDITNYQDFKDISKKEGLNIKETGFFAYQEPIPDIGWSREFSSTAFALKKDEISDVVITQKGYYILRLKEKRAAFIPEFEEIKERLRSQYIEEKSRELSRYEAENLRQKIQEAKMKEPTDFDLKQFVERLGLKLKTTKLFSRGEYIEEIGNFKAFWEACFALKDAEVSKVVSTPKGFYIIRRKEFIPIDQEKFKKVRKEFEEKLLKRKKDKRFRDFFAHLKTEAGLEDRIR